MSKAMYPAVLALLLAGSARAAAQEPDSLTWPRYRLAPDGSQITIYQPQVDSWQYYVQLDYRVAVEIHQPGAPADVPAILRLSSQTDTDLGTGMVVLFNTKILSVSFPGSDTATAQALTGMLTELAPTGPMTMWINQLLAYETRITPPPPVDSANPPGVTKALAVIPTPPVIFHSSNPAILVMYDGKPVWGPIQGTNLLFAINTNWNVLHPQDGSLYYLLNDSTWFQAPAATGPWQPASQPVPRSFYAIPDQPVWQPVLKDLPGKTLTQAQMPRVFSSLQPAELILINGHADLVPISETNLWYVANTESDLFKYRGDDNWYFLVTGRWFRSASLDGPWTYAGNDLPSDFANIPPDSPRGNVLVSVPGTPQAKAAIHAAQVPQKAVVYRDSVTVDVNYDGTAVFQPITGTTMYYATNTTYEVILADGQYYACYNGIWFVAPTSSGPWVAASSVPQMIYTIPPSSPVYNVTYVQVYNSTPTTVTYGYTSGYSGMFVMGVAVGAAVVYGTGYHYPPYYYYPPHYAYPVYHPYPTTYGSAAYYNTATGTYTHSATASGPYGSAAASSSYNPSTGTYSRSASAAGEYGAGTASESYNPQTGASSASYEKTNGYQSWGQSAVSEGNSWAKSSNYSDAQGSAEGYSTSAGGYGATTTNSATGNSASAVHTANNNTYAAADGNVYKSTPSGTKEYSNGSWQSTDDKSGASGTASQSADHPSSTSASQSETDHPSSSSGASSASHPSGGGQTSEDQAARSGGGWGGGGAGGGGGRRR